MPKRAIFGRPMDINLTKSNFLTPNGQKTPFFQRPIERKYPAEKWPFAPTGWSGAHFFGRTRNTRSTGPILKNGPKPQLGGAVHTFLTKCVKKTIPFWPKKCAPLHPIPKSPIFQSRSKNAYLDGKMGKNINNPQNPKKWGERLGSQNPPNQCNQRAKRASAPKGLRVPVSGRKA